MSENADEHSPVVPAAVASVPPAQIPPGATTASTTTPPGGAKLLLGVSVLVLLIAAFLFWRGLNANAGDTARMDAIDQRVAALDPRLAAIEGRPLPPPPPDLRPIQQRLADLDQKLAAMDQRLAGLDQKSAALDQKLGALDQREAAFEQKPPAPVSLDSPARAEIAALSGRIDQLVARLNQIGEATQSDAAKTQQQITQGERKLQDQLAQQDQRLAAAVKNSAQLEQVTTRAAQLATLQGVTTALAAGRPLGNVPGAPPALAAFANKPPPTEAGLRLSYADAADAARTAGLPPKADGALLDRIWARAQSSIVVRQGDRVLVGDAISGILAKAGQQVDAGDLAGALHTLDQLSGPAADAMQPWRQQAQSLLDARAALLAMARG